MGVPQDCTREKEREKVRDKERERGERKRKREKERSLRLGGGSCTLLWGVVNFLEYFACD